MCPAGAWCPAAAVCRGWRQAIYKLVVLATALLFFCLPMATISVLYLLIGLRLRREEAADPQAGGQGQGQDK